MKRDGAAFAIFLALTVVLANPLVLHLANAVEDKQDALLNTWIIGWVGHALISDPLHLFDTNIFYPYTNTLAFSETLLPQGLFALPFNLAFDNTVLGYNLVLLFSFFLAAYAMYLFVFDLTRDRGAGIVAGTIFAFNPYNLGNLAQVQLLSLGWLPLAVMQIRKWRLEVRDWRDLEIKGIVCFVCFFSLQALSSFYYAFLAGVTVALYVIWQFLSDKFSQRNHPTTQPPNHPAPQSLISNLLISSFIISLVLLPFFLPYLTVQRDLGFQRKIEESEPFSASLKLYAEVSPQNILYGNWLAPRPPIIVGGYPLDNLFPGIVALALGIVGVIGVKHRNKWFYFLLLAFAFLLSLGPRLYLTPTINTDITLPYRWLYDALPLMRAFRAPVRFDALVIFALAVLAGCGAVAIKNLTLRIMNYELRITNLLVPLIALEYFAFPAANIVPVPVGDQVPPYVHWLARQPQTTILELPMIASEVGKPLDLTEQYLTTYHWQKTPDGYSGFIPPKRGEIAYEMQFFPNERSISLLQALDVEYVIIHANQIQDWNAKHDAISRVADLQMAQRFGTDFIFRVAPRMQDASLLDARVYFPNPAAPNQNYTAYIIIQNRGTRSFAIKPRDVLQIDARWGDNATQRIQAALPLVTSSVSVVPVKLIAPPRAGEYRMELRVSGTEARDWRLGGDVSVRNEEPARQVVLPTRAVLSAPLKSQYAAGETISIDLTWLPLNKIDAYYSASVRVVDARGNKIIAQDREPRGSTFLWVPGVAVSDQFALTLPRDLAPGEYSVQLLIYQANIAMDALTLDEEYMPRERTVFGNFSVK